MFRPSAQRPEDLVLRTVRAAKAYSVHDNDLMPNQPIIPRIGRCPHVSSRVFRATGWSDPTPAQPGQTAGRSLPLWPIPRGWSRPKRWASWMGFS